MVTCEFMGRLGNNMFQIACAYAIAKKYKDVVGFPAFPYFNLPERISEPENFFIQRTGPNNIPDIKYQKNLCLVGFFQRYEIFDSIKQELMEKVFKVPVDWHPNTIAVHVRRGDFANDTENFPMQPITYYMKALEMLNYKNKQVVFCSDDIAWCKKNFTFPCEFREKTSPIDDIYFMANSDAVVMSNSTFSFWGAYLSLLKRKIIFPLHWFSQKSGRNGYEICPEDWIGI
jgi:hypothetical protein